MTCLIENCKTSMHFNMNSELFMKHHLFPYINPYKCNGECSIKQKYWKSKIKSAHISNWLVCFVLVWRGRVEWMLWLWHQSLIITINYDESYLLMYWHCAVQCKYQEIQPATNWIVCNNDGTFRPWQLLNWSDHRNAQKESRSELLVTEKSKCRGSGVWPNISKNLANFQMTCSSIFVDETYTYECY